MIGTKTLREIEKRIVPDTKQELRDQGHYLTGALEDSLSSGITETQNSTKLEGTAADYFNPVNDGVPADRIPFDSSKVTGAKHSKYIEGLKNFARLKFGQDEKQALSTAFAIAKNHEKQGMPTAGSYNFSSNGRRTQTIEEVLKNNDAAYDSIIENGVSNEIDLFIDKTFTNTVL